MKSIRSVWSYVPGSGREKPEGKSLTVPEMSMSLKTLVERYTRSGQLGDVALLEPVFLGDEEDVPHIERMTPQERLDYSREIKKYIAEVRAQLVKKQREAVEAEKSAIEAIKAEKVVEREPGERSPEGTEGD